MKKPMRMKRRKLETVLKKGNLITFNNDFCLLPLHRHTMSYWGRETTKDGSIRLNGAFGMTTIWFKNKKQLIDSFDKKFMGEVVL